MPQDISLHALAAMTSSILALACGIRTWKHFKERENPLIRYLAFVFFSESLAMLALVPSALLFQSQLITIFLPLAIFFLFLGILFFLQIVEPLE